MAGWLGGDSLPRACAGPYKGHAGAGANWRQISFGRDAVRSRPLRSTVNITGHTGRKVAIRGGWPADDHNHTKLARGSTFARVLEIMTSPYEPSGPLVGRRYLSGPYGLLTAA
ncbi:hypothetical protein [Microvirga massiliensis]|uniref:hypothetical protein n=1 Tax=Microvirga massiliensis TaxID=1033741 RepID=UPI0011C7E926|nr:hypothetical protein [Microvirga massiliensis]